MANVDSLFAEAQALHRGGHMAQAREFCREVLQASPHHGGALHLLGQIAYRGRDADQAAHWFAQAATAALAGGEADLALQSAVYAVTLQETPQMKALFAGVAGTMRFSPDDATVRALMLRAITEEWGPPAALVRAAASLIQPAALADDALLRAMLVAAPIADAALEESLMTARRRLLDKGGDAGFAAALAQQCFLNGYIFWQDKEEAAQVEALRRRAADLSDAELATLACYVPLHEVAGIENRSSGNAAMTALLKLQRDEPAEEKRLAAALPTLTPVAGAHDSSAPWPRWRGAPSAQAPVTLRTYLQQHFPHADCASVPERPAMLAAGCGTAEYALHLATALTLDGVTAIDLDRTVLAYAARKANEAGLTIRFGQGDILQAASLDQTFGLVECGGVLHQLPDPLEGWRALLAALAPDGVMRVAVHSNVAQKAFAPVRAMIAREGFAASDEGIRAARRWLKAQRDADLKPLLEAPVFFTDGGCRHLLSDREHPLTFPQIAGFLAAHDLALIGLDVAPAVAAAYRSRFPDDLTAANLDNWAVFEQDNPQAFAAMIQLWVQRRG